jgi:hypothetical protein
MLFAVSDLVWQALIAGLAACFIAWMQQRTKVAVEQAAKVAVASADTAAVKVEELATKQDEVARVTAQQLDDAAAKVKEVKAALADSDTATANQLHDIAKTGEATHILVNSNMAAQLKISMIALKRLAELTNHPDDMAAAELAAKNYHEHEIKQAKVDAINNTPSPPMLVTVVPAKEALPVKIEKEEIAKAVVDAIGAKPKEGAP